MKFTKTIKFDLYSIGDRMMEDVIYHVDLAITEDNKIIATGATIEEDCIGYVTSLGGKGAIKHWEEAVLSHFEEEATAAEELGEHMSEEEYEAWEDVLMGEAPATPETVLKSGIPLQPWKNW